MSVEKQRLFIKNIEIENVGRFYGSGHSIDLSDSPDKNITIIIGYSGRGKSTIHDMIYWCLYGEHKNSTKRKELELDYGLMNSDVLENLPKGESATASVTISIHDDDGQKYLLTRELTATYNKELPTRRFETQNNSKVQSGIDFETKVKMQLKDKYGDMKIEKNPGLIQHEIEKYLPQHLSDFFLFDGENLLKFHTTASAFIKDGITKISGLGILRSVAEHADTTADNIQRHIGGKSAKASPFASRETRLNERISELNNEIDECEKARDEAQRRFNEISAQIQKNEDGNKLIEKQDEVQKYKERAEKDLKRINEDIKSTLFDKIPQLLIRDTLQQSEQIFARLEHEDKIPPSISRSAIDKILESNPLKCVCGREFEKNDDNNAPWMILNQIKDTIIEDDASQGISLGRDLISRMIDSSSIKKTKSDYHDLVDSRRNKRKEIEEHNINIGNITMQIKNIQYDKGKDFGRLRDDCGNEVMDNTFKIKEKQQELETVKQEWQENHKHFREAIEKEEKYGAESKKISLAKAVSKFIIKLEKNIEEILRKRTEDATSKYFLESAPEKQTFDHVNISNNYNIVVKDSGGLTVHMSKGQAHVLGLSYVAGIREITHTNAFLIIDSPLHNISGIPRNEISEVFSNYLPGVQVVLLVTDTEYLHGDPKGAESVKNILRSKGRIWKEYIIDVKDVEGIQSSQIREYGN